MVSGAIDAKTVRAIVLAAVALGLPRFAAAVELLSPADGAVVPQLWPEQKEFLETPVERRVSIGRTDAESAGSVPKHMKRRRSAKPVRLEWTGDAERYRVTVAREPDGKVFFDSVVTSSFVEVSGRLEIAREWRWTVSGGASSATGRFRTEDVAPRIVTWPGVSNARDIGGRRGLDGRRIRQGLVFRSGGLNGNAKIGYYAYEEILALHKAGTLAMAGAGDSRKVGAEYDAMLSSGKGIDPGFLRLVKSPPREPGEEILSDEARDSILDAFGIRTDLDFRGDWECYGMTGSPLGDSVAWRHFQWRAGYGSFVSPLGRASAAAAFSLFLDERNYPIVFHCIGGTDRTGTFAYLLCGLLGVPEDELILDYDMSFIGGQGPDARHRGWQRTLTDAVRALPGDTLADKLKGYFVSLGFTDAEVERVRGFLLER